METLVITCGQDHFIFTLYRFIRVDIQQKCAFGCANIIQYILGKVIYFQTTNKGKINRKMFLMLFLSHIVDYG